METKGGTGDALSTEGRASVLLLLLADGRSCGGGSVDR